MYAGMPAHPSAPTAALSLKIHEFILPNGELASVLLRRQGERLSLVSDDGELELPTGALRAVMLRYGAPFDEQAMSQSQGTLALAAGASLRHVRHLAGYDVIARDYVLTTASLALCLYDLLRHGTEAGWEQAEWTL